MFNHTRDMNYIITSRKMANYFIKNIPSNGIVPWDFNAPLEPARPADSSAATIAATALLLLAKVEGYATDNASKTAASAASAHWTSAALKVRNYLI